MWPLLERVGVSRDNSYPYPIRPQLADAEDAAAARMQAARLLVIDWEAHPRDTRNDTHHLPARAALRTLRHRLAAPGVCGSWRNESRPESVALLALATLNALLTAGGVLATRRYHMAYKRL